MDQSQSHVSNILGTYRIGRLRYLTYSTALLALLVYPGLLLCIFYRWNNHFSPAGMLLLFVSLLLYALFSVRRIHDLGRSGWWVLLLVCAYLWLFKTSLDMAQVPSEFFHLHKFLIPVLCIAAIYMLLALFPGKPYENRFGRPPTSGTVRTGITAVAIYICLCIVWISIPVGKIYHWEHVQQEAVDESLARVISAKVPLRDYFRVHKAWPKNLQTLFTPVVHPDDSYEYRYWIWQSRDGTLVVEAPLHIDGHPMMSAGGPPWGIAVWTADGGETWHCGPYGRFLGLLPVSCRESPIPQPRVHWLT